MRRLRNWILILGWELLFLLRSIPFWFTYTKRRGPDFMIIGASKSGTSFLFNTLAEHSRIKAARFKEPRFFNRYYFLGLAYYKSYFPIRRKSELSGEATTSYFYNPSVPARVRNAFPDVKLIVLLRDPILRAYSHYQMNVKDESNASFLTALESEKHGEVKYHYLESSLYSKNLGRWLSHFPKEQIKLIKSELLFEKPQEILAGIYRYLGIEDFPQHAYDKVNANSYLKLSQKEYEIAEAYFREDMLSLKNEFGEEFKWNYRG